MKNFETEIHYHNEDKIIMDSFYLDENSQESGFRSDFKLYYRFFRKNLRKLYTFLCKGRFRDILFVTTGDVPFDYIDAFKKQYPNKTFKVLIPIYSEDVSKNIILDSCYFFKNSLHRAVLFKLPNNRYNIEVYGLYCESNLDSNLTRFQKLVSFMKAVRVCVRKLKPAIVHADNVPFFLGAEFEKNVPIYIKIFQTLKDFYFFENNRIEPFWAVINIADKKHLKKLCKDKIIKKNISNLFNLRNSKKFYPMTECLELIYNNYSDFRKYIDKCEDIEENIIFNKLNNRVLQLFPNLFVKDENFYNVFRNSLKRCDFLSVFSKTYYCEIFNNFEKFSILKENLNLVKSHCDYVYTGITGSNEKLYVDFNIENFRENKPKNKSYLIKEFSQDRVRTNFVDISLFNDETYKIQGYLDSFYSSPLLFVKLGEDIFGDGVDIVLNIILKLFELNKNVQVIIYSEKVLESNYVKSWLDFIKRQDFCNGRWVFIEGKIKISQFFAASDMVLLPKRYNTNSIQHYLAMSYGCIPVVSKIGIYNDTVIDIFDDISNGNGFKTKENLMVNDDVNLIFYNTLNKALNLYNQSPTSWNSLIKNAMNYNSDWNFEVIEKYNKIYEIL